MYFHSNVNLGILLFWFVHLFNYLTAFGSKHVLLFPHLMHLLVAKKLALAGGA